MPESTKVSKIAFVKNNPMNWPMDVVPMGTFVGPTLKLRHLGSALSGLCFPDLNARPLWSSMSSSTLLSVWKGSSSTDLRQFRRQHPIKQHPNNSFFPLELILIHFNIITIHFAVIKLLRNSRRHSRGRITIAKNFDWILQSWRNTT